MFLVSAKVGPFKSIVDPQSVAICKDTTVLVGMNEAGKTVFLQSLEKSEDASGIAKFNHVEDYPRKDLSPYLKKHQTSPAVVTVFTYQLAETEIAQLESDFQVKVPSDFKFLIEHSYDNKKQISIKIDEAPVLKALIASGELSSDATAAANKARSIRELPVLLKGTSITDKDKAFLATVEARILKVGDSESVVESEICKWLSIRVPQFLFFSDYNLLPDKTNLADLVARVAQAKSDPKQLKPGHLAVLALLRMADISVTEFTRTGGYEQLKAKIEAVSISLTDQIMAFWKQNEDLEVEVDIKPDPEDEPPFNNGVNLYLRIKNRRHRGVSTPFSQRSRGFIWFFSFLVWFDKVTHQVTPLNGGSPSDLILLLDEPGLSLHALAQGDFLRYIDELSKKHQVIYTTHSPFMVHSDRLNQVRVVEDKEKIGTVISENVTGADSRTIFPLQAALGWTIAQNLFIAERNLLVEGPADLVYLKAVSAFLEANGETGLRDDIVIVPTGGLDKVVTFIALLGANGLKFAVLHDFRGAPEQKLLDLVKCKMISTKGILNASQFRDLGNIGKDGQPTDIEDLFSIGLFLDYFNKTFANNLHGLVVRENDLPEGNRILERLERYMTAKRIILRPSGGFNHYAVASNFASGPPAVIDADTRSRFRLLFQTVNSFLGT